jgi:hypothetical protein
MDTFTIYESTDNVSFSASIYPTNDEVPKIVYPDLNKGTANIYENNVLVQSGELFVTGNSLNDELMLRVDQRTGQLIITGPNAKNYFIEDGNLKYKYS